MKDTNLFLDEYHHRMRVYNIFRYNGAKFLIVNKYILVNKDVITISS